MSANPYPYPTHPTPIRLRAYPERALRAGWEPTPYHAAISRDLDTQQVAHIRAVYDGTTTSLRALAGELGLPFYVVREQALSLKLRNPQQYQPPRKRYSPRRGKNTGDAGKGSEEVAS